MSGHYKMLIEGGKSVHVYLGGPGLLALFKCFEAVGYALPKPVGFFDPKLNAQTIDFNVFSHFYLRLKPDMIKNVFAGHGLSDDEAMAAVSEGGSILSSVYWHDYLPRKTTVW